MGVEAWGSSRGQLQQITKSHLVLRATNRPYRRRGLRSRLVYHTKDKWYSSSISDTMRLNYP